MIQDFVDFSTAVFIGFATFSGVFRLLARRFLTACDACGLYGGRP